MENSVLSDASGIQKNISKMYEEYAQKIGKSTDALTQAEKVQAVYNGYVEEAKDFTGSAAEMANSYQGQQAQVNATNLEFSRTIGESMIPILTQYSSLQLNITKGLTEFTSNHKSATSGIITFTTTMLAGIVALTTAKKAYTAYKTAATAAEMTTKAFTLSLMTNPVTLIAVGIASVVAGLTAFDTKMQESIDKMQEATEKTNTLIEAMQNFNENGQFNENEKSIVEQEKNEAQAIIDIYEEKNKKIEELEQKKSELVKKYSEGGMIEATYKANLNMLNQEIYTSTEDLKKYQKQLEKTGKTIEGQKSKVKELTRELSQSNSVQEYSNKTNVKSQREQLINIAQTKADIEGKKELLNILKQGKTSTEQYADAKNKLVKVYPELANVNENTIANTEALISSEEKAAQSEWDLAQKTIQNSIAELDAMKNNDAKVQEIARATKQKVEDVKASIVSATNALMGLSKLSLLDLATTVDTTNYQPKKISSGTTSSKASKSYENKALDNYKSLIEYKKSLDKISLKQEIEMYQTALNKYAKTTSEKRELRVKIYELEKELQEDELNNYTSKIEHKKSLDKLSLEKEINNYEYAYKYLAKTTEQKQELEEKLYELKKELAQKNKELMQADLEAFKENMEEKKKIMGATYTVEDQRQDYDELIELHNKYLDKILADERLSKDERKEIIVEEMETIKNIEEEKRTARIQSINDTVSQLTSAITKQLEELQNADKKAIENNIELVEKWKDARVNAINEEYNARIENIQKELDALDKSEEDKTRAEEDAEYERKKNRLQQLIDYEHDATTKANYEKELNKLISEHQSTLDKRALSDKKEALKNQKELLKEEQDNKIQNIEDEASKRKEQYEKQLDELEEYYTKQKNMAQETAQKMLLNVDTNQNQIISLLKNYSDAYESTGQTLGEKLAQGINEGLSDRIGNIIKKVQTTLDTNINSKIIEWMSQSYKYSAGTSKKQSKTINVTQQNYIEQNPEMPSETYRKLNDISKSLASQLAGI
mgnify:CR=1 FL=1